MNFCNGDKVINYGAVSLSLTLTFIFAFLRSSLWYLIFKWDFTDACGCFIIYHCMPFLCVKSLIWHNMFGWDILVWKNVLISSHFYFLFYYFCGLMFPGFHLAKKNMFISFYFFIWGVDMSCCAFKIILEIIFKQFFRHYLFIYYELVKEDNRCSVTDPKINTFLYIFK